MPCKISLIKNKYIAIILFGLFSLTAQAQNTPQAFNWQGVINDATGNPLADTTIGLQFTIHLGSATGTTGTTVYTQTKTLTTNSNGLINTVVGDATNNTEFDTIDWGSNNYYLEVGIDTTGGTTYTSLGAAQLLSVPYALYSGSNSNNSIIEDTDGDTHVSVEKNSNENKIRFQTNGVEAMQIDESGDVGIGIEPSERLNVLIGVDNSVEVLDQSAPYFSATEITDPAWQSFTAGISGELSKIGLQISLDAIGGSRTLSIYEGEGDTGVILYSGVITITQQNGIYPVSGVYLTAGNKYTIHLDTAWKWALKNNGYPYGRSNFNEERDYSFKTYMYGNHQFKVSDSGVAVGEYLLPVAGGEVNQVLTSDGSGNSNWQDVSLPEEGFTDSDGNTKIQVEETNNDDTIRFDIAGNEVATISEDVSGIDILGGFTEPSGVLFLESFGMLLKSNDGGQILTLQGALPGQVYPYSRIDFRNSDSVLYTGASIRSHNDGNQNSGDLRFLTANNQTLSNALTLTKDGIINTHQNWISGDGDAEGLIIGAEGNIGIGELDPNEKLDVNGNIKLSGRLDIQNSNNNINIGQGSGIDTSTNTIAIGRYSLDNAVNSDGNVSVGDFSGSDLVGNYNSFFGTQAGTNLSSGTNNVFIGTSSGAGTTAYSGDNNTAIGTNAGENMQGSGNVFLGYNSGSLETGNNKLYIENSNSNTPLIYGEFDTDLVKINGQLEITNGIIFGDGAAQVSLNNNWLSNDGDAEGIQIDTNGAVTIDATSTLPLTISGNNATKLKIEGNTNDGQPAQGAVLELNTNRTSGSFRGAGIEMSNRFDDKNWFAGMFYQDDFNNYRIGYYDQPQTGNNNLSGYVANAVFTLSSSGNLNIAGTLTQNSDRTLKKDIQPLTNTLDKIAQINAYYYRWKDAERRGDKRQLGVIAQEVQAVYPELVSKDENDILSVNYVQLSAVLLEAVKEQQKEILKLKADNSNLKADNSILKADVSEIKAYLGLNKNIETAKK